METGLRLFLVAFLVIAAFFVGAGVGQRSDGVGGFLGGPEAELSSEALGVIDDNYFREVDDAALEDASVKAMVRKLRRANKDRFSHYFPPKAFARFQELTSGRFTGVGLSVNEVNRGLRVANVFKSSPAREAGIRAGDVITAVDGESIAGEDSQLATGKIKGKAGTEVTLTVVRPSTGEKRDYTMKRRQLSIPAVESELRRAAGRPVGYIRLLGFSQGAHSELRDAVDRLDDRGAEGLVIDLRGNGGGLLDEAVLTSSVFVEDGVIVSTRGRTQSERTFEAVGDAVSPRPIVILINGDSASASEIFTASLSDAGLARVAGEKSFGKGVFQEVIELENGGALDLTVGEYLTRDGDSLADDGIEPELPAVDVPASKPDEGLQRALAALGETLSEQQ